MIGDILQPTHLLFILVVALLVLGPKRLPEVGRSLGRGLRDFRDAMSGEDRDRPDEMMTRTSAPADATSSADDVVLTPTNDAILTPDSADHTLPVSDVVLTPDDAVLASVHAESSPHADSSPHAESSAHADSSPHAESTPPATGEPVGPPSAESATPASEPVERVG